jgi:hypothetical protein
MSSTNTEYEFTSSLKKDSNIYITKDRQYIYYNDLANGAYNSNTSEVKFELISLANTNQFVNWAESFVLIPLQLTMKATTGLFNTSAENAFALSLKNGYQHIVDSLLITINDNPINQPCQGANIPNSFRMYEMSEDDRKILGDSMNFYLDTGDSIRYITPSATRYATGSYQVSVSNAGIANFTLDQGTNPKKGQKFILGGITFTIVQANATTPGKTFDVTPVPAANIAAGNTTWITPFTSVTDWNSGLGESNNIISKPNSIFNPIEGFLTSTINEGRQKRIMSTGFDPSQNQIRQNFISESKVAESFRNCIVTNTATEITYNLFCTIPMCTLHNFFDALPIARGLSVRLNLYLNTGITINETIDGIQHVSIDSYSMPRQTCPFMVSPIGNDAITGTGLRNFNATKVTYSLKIGNSAQTNCRFYASLYTFNPQTESLYISSPERNILYNDVVQYLIPNVEANQSVNNLITSGISRLRGLLMVPILSGGSNGCGGLDAKQSPFSSCPATCFPYSKITNFQIQISGRPCFNTPLSHTFMFYNTGVKPELSINGGSMRSLGMSSGCISKSDFENGYGLYYVDLTNIESEAEDNASKSVQVLFQNSGGTNAFKIDFYIYLFFQKQVAINISNGAFIKIE